MLPFKEASCGGRDLLSSFLFFPLFPTSYQKKSGKSYLRFMRCNGNGDKYLRLMRYHGNGNK